MRITRGVLEVLAAFNHPVTIVTKSALVTRDIDILAEMARKSLAAVSLSITTLDSISPARWSRAPPRRPAVWRPCASSPMPAYPWACSPPP